MNQVKSPSSMLESLQPAPRGVLKYSGWILLRNAQVQNTLRLYCQHAERLVQVTFSAVQTAQVTAAQAMTRWTEGRRTLCRGTAGRLQPWGCSPRCPAAPLVRWNLSLLLTCYTRYINSFFLKKTVLVHTGPNSNAGVCTSHRPNQHHPSRPNQDDAVQAEAAEITPEGG